MKNTSIATGEVLRYAMAGKAIVCPHCGGAEFDGQKTLMNTRGATFFNLDWLNRSAFTLTCMTCSRVEWFRRQPDPRH